VKTSVRLRQSRYSKKTNYLMQVSINIQSDISSKS
jgi:hypothetical protein